MARFFGSVKGSRGEATRLGHSSMVASANGWHLGATVHIFEGQGGKDTVSITLGGGSSGSERLHLGMYTREDMLNMISAQHVTEKVTDGAKGEDGKVICPICNKNLTKAYRLLVNSKADELAFSAIHFSAHMREAQEAVADLLEYAKQVAAERNERPACIKEVERKLGGKA